MHAYSMKDPKFFSGKEHAKLHYPQTGERFCIQCHNPVAYVTGEDLNEYTNPEDFLNSNLPQQIKEGISCDVCHTSVHLSNTVHAGDDLIANAEYFLNPQNNIKYGSIKDPKENNYHGSEYNPIFKRSESCLPCHDFKIRNIEAEITFTEWNRIPGLAMSGALSCQDCHMQLKSDGTHDHRFTGVDLDLTYPIGESPLHFEVEKMLKSAAEVKFGYYNEFLPDSIGNNELLIIPVSIISRTAHGIPSGTSFAREAWLEIVVTNQQNNIVFESGSYDRKQPLDYDDDDLLFFTTFFLNEHGDTLESVVNIKEMINRSLPAFSSRFHNYELNINNVTSDYIIVNIRLLFRAFKPHLLEAHPELLENLPVFEISAIQDTVFIK